MHMPTTAQDDVGDLAPIVEDLIRKLADGADHPEIWSLLQEVCTATPDLAPVLVDALENRAARLTPAQRGERLAIEAACGVLPALIGDAAGSRLALQRLRRDHPGMPLVEGAWRHLQALIGAAGLLATPIDAAAADRALDPGAGPHAASGGSSPLGASHGPDPNALFPVPGDRRVCFIKNAVRNPNIVIGDYTYYDDPDPPEDFEHRNVLYHYPFIGDRLVIGRYCAIARGVRFIMNGANHGTRGFSSYLFPFFRHGWETGAADPARVGNPYGRGDTVIGNDVWIGYQATILPGVRIGDGAVIGAHAVVGTNVAPYTVVAGNPARVLRARFDPDTVELLQQICWWDWPAEDVTRHVSAIASNDLLALRAAAAAVNARRVAR